MKNKLLQLGRAVPTPQSPDDAKLDAVANAHWNTNYLVRFTAPEFTCLCPITGQPDWTVTTGEDPNSSGGEQGVTDVHSSSGDVSSEGTPYSEW